MCSRKWSDCSKDWLSRTNSSTLCLDISYKLKRVSLCFRVFRCRSLSFFFFFFFFSLSTIMPRCHSCLTFRDSAATQLDFLDDLDSTLPISGLLPSHLILTFTSSPYSNGLPYFGRFLLLVSTSVSPCLASSSLRSSKVDHRDLLRSSLTFSFVYIICRSPRCATHQVR